MKELFRFEDDLYVIHRRIPAYQMTPKFHGFESDDINGMGRLWANQLRENCKQIDKVFNKDNHFMFCEKVEKVDPI